MRGGPASAPAAARRDPDRRRPGLVLLVVFVALAHLLLGDWIAEGMVALGEGRVDREPVRLKAAFVTVLQPVAPPTHAPRPAPPPARRKLPRPLAAASAASAADDQAPAPAVVAAASAPPPEVPETPSIDADAPAAATAQLPVEPAVPLASPVQTAASAPPDATTFDWPRSTRLSYRLSGYYRGPVEGQASVEWLRDGPRYQVHLEVSVGPSFAPLVSRRMSSDGEIVAEGLAPRRYDELTRVALSAPRQLSMAFDAATVRLANGTLVPRPPGVQDTASQFVQLTWLFTTQPERLRPGQSVSLMLALPRHVNEWTYDVLGAEQLYTPTGEIEAVHVRPRRAAGAGGDLVAEAWFAPTLQYLPVRIVIRQDAETFVDLLLDRLPQQAVEAAASSAAR